MATIKITGDALVIESAVKFDDIVELEGNKALQLFEEDEDGKKQLCFKVGAHLGAGSVSGFGITFGGATHDENKLATVTLAIPAGVEDAVEYAAQTVGTALLKLNKIEAQVPEAIAAREAEKALIKEQITVM